MYRDLFLKNTPKKKFEGFKSSKYIQKLFFDPQKTSIHQKLNGTLPTDPEMEVAIELLDSQV